MNWQQRAAALNGLAPLSVRLRHIGNWYVQHSVEVKKGATLVSHYGDGKTPEDAINDHWRQLVAELDGDQYLVINAPCENRRAVRWNGYMWQDIEEDK